MPPNTASYNKKSPTIKRILREASELSSAPSPDYHAAPLDSNLFEWHFTLRGPPSTPYENGIYHGRISLPPTYPLRPPSFRFLTPSGRFEVNREICLSISGHHEDTWQPAWGVRTAVVALRAFMEGEAGGQVGGVDCSVEVRKKISGESRGWKCAECGKTNEEILKESAEAAKEAGVEERKEEVPDEMKFGFKKTEGEGGTRAEAAEAATGRTTDTEAAAVAAAGVATEETTAGTVVGTPTPTSTARVVEEPVRAQPVRQTQPVQQQQAPLVREDNFWLDRLIWALVALLFALVCKRLFGFMGAIVIV